MNEYLDKKIEQKLIDIGNKRYFRAILLTIGWSILVVIFWLLFMILGCHSFLFIANYVPLVLCALPCFFTWKTLSSKTFYATVNYTVNSTQFQQLKEAYVRDRPETVDVLEVRFKKDDGKEFTIQYKKKNYVMDGIHYDSGDRVIFVRGLKCPVEIPITDTIERTCPVCGRTLEVQQMTCKRCNFDFSDLMN